jgi:hypothetical protein
MASIARPWLPSVFNGCAFLLVEGAPVIAVVKQIALDDGCDSALGQGSVATCVTSPPVDAAALTGSVVFSSGPDVDPAHKRLGLKLEAEPFTLPVTRAARRLKQLRARTRLERTILWTLRTPWMRPPAPPFTTVRSSI